MTLTPLGRRGRACTGLALAVGLALGALVLSVPSAWAHASLVSTDPAEGAVLAEAPARVTLTFDEPVTLAAASAHLYDASGDQLDTDARSVDRIVTVTPAEDLGQGTFVLTYRVISADSHPIAGSLSFSVGSPSDTVVAPRDARSSTDRGVVVVHGALQGLTYLALLMSAGLAVFAVVLLPAAAALQDVRRRLRLLARLAAGVAGAGALLLVPVGVLYQQGLGLTGLGSGLAWTGWLSADGLLAALVLVGLGIAAVALTDRPPSRAARGLVLGGAGAALAAVALVGHTRSFGPSWLVVASDVVHVTAAAVWFGGLVGLAIALPALAKRERLAASTLGRFSMVAAALLAAVAVAGLLLGWRVLGSWVGLVETAYGLVLLVKTAVVVLVVAVAAWNRYALLPAMLRADGYQARMRAGDRLRTTVRLEAVGLVCVLLLTGFLVNRVPSQDEDATDAERSTVSAVADDVRVVAHLAPGRVGPNTVGVQVQNLAGEPIEPYATPVVSVASGTLDLGNRPIRNIDSGTYATTVVIPSPTTWTIQVSVRTGEFDNPVLTLTVDVSA